MTDLNFETGRLGRLPLLSTTAIHDRSTSAIQMVKQNCSHLTSMALMFSRPAMFAPSQHSTEQGRCSSFVVNEM